MHQQPVHLFIRLGGIISFRRLASASIAILITGTGVLAAAPAAAASVVAASVEPVTETTQQGSDSSGPDADPDKSFAFYAGKNRTESGHTLIGGFGHEPSSHWLEIVPAQKHEAGSTMVVGATDEADMPGQLTEIPQTPETARYITSNYSEFAGFPAPLTNGGLNEHGVAARDVWSNSREELWDMTPPDQTGPSYSDLSRIAMERATSARDAVDILGALIDEYGYTTYGGNSHLFADENEGWVFVEYSGGLGLWAAERLSADDIRVSYPGYIQEFPVDAINGDNPDYVGSANLVDVAVQQGWWESAGRATMNLQDVYQQEFPTNDFEVGQDADPDDPAPYRNPVSLEGELESMDALTLQDAMRLVRDPRWSDDRSGYGQVAEIRDDLADPRLQTLWVAVTAAATAPYIPVMIGTGDVPIEYTQHRYLTAGASASYVSPEYAEQEATEFATQTYKRLMYAACARPEAYFEDVTAAFEGMEATSIDEHAEVIARASDAIESGDDSRAEEILTEFTSERATTGLGLGNYLLEDILERSTADGGIHRPDVDVPVGTAASERSLDMSMQGVSSRDRMNCDVGGGWADGSTVDRQGEYGDPADVPEFAAAATEADSTLTPVWIGVSALGGLLVGAGVVWLVSRRRRA
ncbi:C69 family dipeptidase [Glaciibacter superstes]|uniref:C69 family dipeptidase n=1 Tax=Glaciibacter superstes TaxID=501023 RepID=UPI0003B78EE7|nr:C69 family dipeptidase [Glaciibacter superstes]